MAVKSTKKQTKDKSVAPVSYRTVEEQEEKKSLTDILNASLKENGLEDDTAKITEEQTGLEGGSKNEKPQSVEELVSAIEGINKEFENVTDRDYYPEDEVVEIPPSLDLEKMEVPEIDREKIKEETEKEEGLKTETEKSRLSDEVETKVKEKESEIEDAKEKSEKKKKEVNEIYDEYKVSVESDAIKRGLARSSVALLSIEGVEASRANELVKLAENLTSSINLLESDITKLQQGLDSSLEQLDLELAENINSKLAKKIEELEKKRNEAIEFNNKVNQMEAEYQMKRLDKVDEAAKLEEELAKKYKGYAETDKREKKVQLALDYFSTMDKTTALGVIISSPELASVLGDAYYDLYYYTMRR